MSIRWRLPLSYAAVALICALALGGILLTTLDNYYKEQERAYLERNAESTALGINNAIYWSEMPVAENLASAYRKQFPENLLPGFAFVSRTRIRLLDVDHRVISDTGDPRNRQYVVFDATSQGQQPDATDAGDFTITYGGVDGIQENIAITEAGQEIPREYLFNGEIIDPDTLPENTLPPDSTRPFAPVRLWSTAYGYEFTAGAEASPVEQTDEVVTIPVYDSNNQLMGYLEVSDGPAFGVEIVSRVADGLITAGGVAVILAALAGLYMSRQINRPLLALTEATGDVAEGDLSTRVNLNRRDEFGVLARTFDEMAHRVEHTINTLRRFVGDAAHELNTPITALRTNLEIAADHSTRAADYITRSRQQLQRLETLTNSLLDLARLETRQIETAPVDLVELTRQTCYFYASRIEQAGLELRVNLPDTPVIACINESGIQRIMSNLLDNACKFTPENGQIIAGMYPLAQQVEIRIQDTGIGIPPDDLPRLFDRFYRGRNVSAYLGNGLGLAMIKVIVEAHHGNVTVKSDQDGTRFSVWLPR